MTKASSAASRRDLGACQGNTEEVNSLERTPPSRPPPHSRARPYGSLSITASTRPTPTGHGLFIMLI